MDVAWRARHHREGAVERCGRERNGEQDRLISAGTPKQKTKGTVLTEQSLVAWEQERDRREIIRLAQNERLFRDTWQWEKMHKLYHADSHVRVSWFDGTGADFVDASRASAERGQRSFHLVGPTSVEILGDRAIADTGCAIHVRSTIEGVEVDICGYARHRSMVEKIDGEWKLRSFRAVYQKDTMQPVIPSEVIPVDRDRLLSYRPSYRYLAYSVAARGAEPSQHLPGIDRPETIEAVVAEEEAWLRQAEPGRQAG